MILLTPQNVRQLPISRLALIMPTSSSRLLAVVVLAFLMLQAHIMYTALVSMLIKAKLQLAQFVLASSQAQRNVSTLPHTLLLAWRKQANMMLLLQTRPSLISPTTVLPMLHQALPFP